MSENVMWKNSNQTANGRTREQLEAEWRASAALQREYVTASSYASAMLFGHTHAGSVAHGEPGAAK